MRNPWISLVCLTAVLCSQSLGAGNRLRAQHLAGAGPAGGGPAAAVADFNGDGIPDLALANFGSDIVSVYLGNGDGTFGSPRDFAVGSGPLSVVVGDFDGDGSPDLVVVNFQSSNVSVLLGNGDGTFQAARNIPVGGGPVCALVIDINGDGVQDLAVANSESESVSILLGNGDGTFQAPRNFDVSFAPDWLAASTDLLVVNRFGNFAVLLGGATP